MQLSSDDVEAVTEALNGQFAVLKMRGLSPERRAMAVAVCMAARNAADSSWELRDLNARVQNVLPSNRFLPADWASARALLIELGLVAMRHNGFSVTIPPELADILRIMTQRYGIAIVQQSVAAVEQDERWRKIARVTWWEQLKSLPGRIADYFRA